MKAILAFNLPEDQEDFDAAVKADKMRSALQAIADDVFRPARKHGYHDSELNQLIESIPNGAGYELVSKLEDKFYSILTEYDVELN